MSSAFLPWVHLHAVLRQLIKGIVLGVRVRLICKVKHPSRALHLSGHMTGLLINQGETLLAATLLYADL